NLGPGGLSEAPPGPPFLAPENLPALAAGAPPASRPPSPSPEPLSRTGGGPPLAPAVGENSSPITKPVGESSHDVDENHPPASADPRCDPQLGLSAGRLDCSTRPRDGPS